MYVYMYIIYCDIYNNELANPAIGTILCHSELATAEIQFS